MRKLCITLPICLLGYIGNAQSALQHPGSICCDQVICPSEPIAELTESMPVSPPESQIAVEYAWYELVVDTTAPNGTRWSKITGANGKNYQPTGISTPYGGFYMRAARQTGTLPYLFSNIVNVKQLGATSMECTSAAGEPGAVAKVAISPNPASDQLNIVVDGNQSTIAGYQVSAMNGNAMISKSGIALPNLTINVADWPSGFYFLKIIFSDGKTSIHKWVKV
jgi:hypothetical protein